MISNCVNAWRIVFSFFSSEQDVIAQQCSDQKTPNESCVWIEMKEHSCWFVRSCTIFKFAIWEHTIFPCVWNIPKNGRVAGLPLWDFTPPKTSDDAQTRDETGFLVLFCSSSESIFAKPPQQHDRISLELFLSFCCSNI